MMDAGFCFAMIGWASVVVARGSVESSRPAPQGPAEMTLHVCCPTPADQPSTKPNATPAPSADKAKDATPPPQSAAPRKNGQTISGNVSINGSLDATKQDLTRAVVYIDTDPTLDADPIPADPVVVAQINKAFVPSFAVVAKGTVVEFPNWDDFDHNVFSRSKAAPAFDLDRYPKGQSKSRQFDKVGVVQVFCNIHPQMRAIVFVTPSVHFTRASADGAFELKDIPPGKYTLVVWHERCEEQRTDIEVKDAAVSGVSITLSESRRSIMANTPPRENGYGVERGLGVKREKLNLPVVTDSHPAPPRK